MSLSLWAAFVLATAVLMAIPGPNVAVIVGNSLRYGPRQGLMTVAGIACASLIQLGLTMAGLAAVLAHLGSWFVVVRWLGVLYLIGLGIRQWRAVPTDLGAPAPPPVARRIVLTQAFVVSLTNPKTLLFFAAFLPQFITADAPAGRQFAILAMTYLGVATTVDSGWVMLATRARRVLVGRGKLRNRLSGAMLMVAGGGLALVRSP